MIAAPRSIGSRTLLITLAASTLGSLLASLLAAGALDMLVADQADRRLRAATDTLAIELDEERQEDDKDSLDEILDDENREISTSGIRLAVYAGTTLIAGNGEAPPVQASSCETMSEMRSCGKQYGRWLLVAAQEDERDDWRELLLAAVGLSVVLGSLLSFLLSRRLAHWATRPLVQLSTDLDAIDAQNSVRRRPWSNRDVLEVRAIQDAIDTLLGRVDSLLARSQRFSRDAAHELLTPLAVLSTKVQLIAENVGLSTEIQEELASLVKHLTQLSNLVDGLLLLATDPEISKKRFEPVSLDESLRDVEQSLEPDQRQRLNTRASTEGLVFGDPVLIRGAITNAVTNALKFSTDKVHLRMEESANHVRVHVEDSGPGVPEELRQRVLEPFFRAPSDPTPGYGLGLAIVAHIMKAHRGSAQFEEAEVGAHLILSFPRWQAEHP